MLPLSPTDVLLIWREKNGKLYWTQTKITRNLRRYAPTKGNQEMKEKKESQIGPRVVIRVINERIDGLSENSKSGRGSLLEH